MIKIEIKIDDLNINYIKQGKGDNVLIVPGWGAPINTYMTLFNSISKYACCYVLDMPGVGESDEPSKSWNVNDYVEFLKKFIKALGLKELSLIGHSNGGRVIIKMMSEHPTEFKVNKIILMGSAGIKNKRTFKQNCKVYTYKFGKKILSLKIVKKIWPDAIENFKKNAGSEDYRNSTPIMRETMVKLINTDLTDDLHKIEQPTLIIWGEKDTAEKIQNGELMEKLIPDAGLVKIEDGSHFVFLEKPGYVNLVIKTFLEQK